MYQRRTWDEFKRILSVAHASQPVERAENLNTATNSLGCVEAPFAVQAIKTYEVSPSFWITLCIDNTEDRIGYWKLRYYQFSPAIYWYVFNVCVSSLLRDIPRHPVSVKLSAIVKLVFDVWDFLLPIINLIFFPLHTDAVYKLTSPFYYSMRSVQISSCSNLLWQQYIA